MDKWFKDYCFRPGLQKLLRKGEVCVGGKRVKGAKVILTEGQTLRISPGENGSSSPECVAVPKVREISNVRVGSRTDLFTDTK